MDDYFDEEIPWAAASICHEDEEALVVLRRPAPPEPSPADEHIFRLIREAAATRETAPWSFFVTGPDGARELHAPEFCAELPAQAEGTRRPAKVS